MRIGLGVGIEAGLLSLEDARAFVCLGLADRCVRVLVEPLDNHPATAITHAVAMDDVLSTAGMVLEQIHHGDGLASWAVSARAVSRSHSVRTGLEDATVLPDGRPATDNATLAGAALTMLSSHSTS